MMPLKWSREDAGCWLSCLDRGCGGKVKGNDTGRAPLFWSLPGTQRLSSRSPCPMRLGEAADARLACLGPVHVPGPQTQGRLSSQGTLSRRGLPSCPGGQVLFIDCGTYSVQDRTFLNFSQTEARVDPWREANSGTGASRRDPSRQLRWGRGAAVGASGTLGIWQVSDVL